MAGENRDCLLYLLSPPQFEPAAFAPQLEAALAAAPETATGERRVGAFMLRMPDAPDAQLRAAVAALAPVCARHGTPLILHEAPHLAAELEVDGMHVVESGTSVQEARRLMGPGRIVGKTCLASRDLAMKAGDDGADYVAFASFYEAETSNQVGPARPDILMWWQEFFVLPCVAMGGITPQNCRPLVMAGADFVLAMNAVWNHPDGPAAAVGAFDAAITEALQNH